MVIRCLLFMHWQRKEEVLIVTLQVRFKRFSISIVKPRNAAKITSDTMAHRRQAQPFRDCFRVFVFIRFYKSSHDEPLSCRFPPWFWALELW